MTEILKNVGLPKITPSFRKKILKDWQLCIPSLTIRKPMALSRRVGPLLISIGFDATSGSKYYQVAFNIHNLSSPFEFLTATMKTYLRTIKTKAPDLIGVQGHEEGKYKEAALRMRAQAPLPLEGPISLNRIIQAYQSYMENGGTKTIDLVQDPALIAAWAGQAEKAKEVLDWGYEAYKAWAETFVDNEEDVDGWLLEMQEKISNPDQLRKIAEEQAILHGVDKVPMEDLILD